MPSPSVLQNPAAAAKLKRGFDRLADLLALTLGPAQGVVLSSPLADARGKPELLSDAATIARRVLQLPDRAEDIGAMLLRNLVWRMRLKAGDGGATAAVLAQAIVGHAFRYVAAGGNSSDVRRGLSRATQAAVDALRAMAQPVNSTDELPKVAQAVTGEDELGRMLGEMFARLGADGHVMIEEYMARYLASEYHEGGRFGARLASPYFVTDAVARKAIHPECYVVLCAGDLTTLDDVQPMLELASQTEIRRLLVAAHGIKGEALNTLVINHQQNRLPVVAVELRRAGEKRENDFADLAALTGATVLAAQTGRTARGIRPEDFGGARRVEASPDELIVVGFDQHAPGVCARTATLRARLADGQVEEEAREELRERLARLAGSVATLRVGAATDVERAVLKEKAEKGIRVLPLALREGVVAGGGVAYLNCIEAVCGASTNSALADGERMGVETLARALEAPFRRIVQNAGVAKPSAMLDEARHCGRDYGYDALANRVVHMREAGIVDAAGVLRVVLETAVSGAVMALTTETIVLHENPQTSYEP